jgi:hypothetical protein
VKSGLGLAFNSPKRAINMKLYLLLFSAGIFLIQNSFAQYSMDKISNLRNDKEVIIRSIKKSERLKIASKFPSTIENAETTNVFYLTLKEFLEREDKQCELKLIELIKKNFEAAKLDSSEEGLQDLFKMFRITHAIDDIFYDILTSLNKDYASLAELKLDRKRLQVTLKHKKLINKNNVKELFSGFSEWPDESSRCVYKEYIYIKSHIFNKNEKLSQRDKHFKILTKKALDEKVIDIETFNKLEFLRTKSTVNTRNYWLADYFKVIFNAKNKMRPINATYVVKNLEDESDYSTERVKRFSRITRRKLLYKKYDETQIILLAQILQKASRRMGADPDTISLPPRITQEFSILNDQGERETYVEQIELDPQSQYNLARRLLRKDMTDLQMMDVFVGKQITHEDIVMAAFETGYITLEDIEYVVKYDDLWNPNKTSFEKIVGFVGTIAGVSTIFLPPPWNITISIAIGVIEGLILGTQKNGAENDNPSTFIE